MNPKILFVVSAILLVGCQTTKPLDGKRLSQELLIVDTHIDVPYRLMRDPQDVSVRTEAGEFDYPRATAGGLNVPFMSIYIPAAVETAGGAKELADELIDMMEGLQTSHPDKFVIVSSTKQVEGLFRENQKSAERQRIMLALGMENGGPIEGSLENLQHFYERGIRYITLTHSKSNHISDSSYDDNKQWGGLSPFGKELIPAMNQVGVMVDVSHVSDAAFYDVIALSQTPVIASHSSARHFVPNFERNMDDTMLRALARNGGVMQLNIGSTFISEASRASANERNAALRAYVADNGIAATDRDAIKTARDRLFSEMPLVFADLSDVLDHIDHVVDLVGIDHIGIGSDFDGVGDTLPTGFKDVSEYPNFIDGLISRGYNKEDIEKILSGNLMRVWRAVEAHAAKAD